jgi:hypothetical protein
MMHAASALDDGNKGGLAMQKSAARAFSKHQDLINTALAEAREANERMSGAPTIQTLLGGCRPLRVRRVFFFATDQGADFGFTHDEFGCLEPFLSLPVI